MLPLHMIASLLRLHEWFRAKVVLLLALGAWAYSQNPAPRPLHWLLPVWLISFLALGSFGYFINDCFDIEQDLIARKKNEAASLTVTSRIAVACLLLTAALSVWLFLETSPRLWLLLGIQAGLLSAYAMPPIRLKRRPWGAAADALYAFVVPAAITLTAFGGSALLISHGIVSALLFGALFLSGLRNILQHHLEDREADAHPSCDTYNLALRFPPDTLTQRLATILIPAELLCWLAAMICMGRVGVLAACCAGAYLYQHVSLLKHARQLPANWPNPLLDTWLPLSLTIGICLFYPLKFLVFLLLAIPFKSTFHVLEYFYYKIEKAYYFLQHNFNILFYTKITPAWYRLLATPLGKPYYFLYNLFHRK